LHAVRRVVGVAGGRRKAHAIRGALTGKLVNVLITDLASAERLLARTRSSFRKKSAALKHIRDGQSESGCAPRRNRI